MNQIPRVSIFRRGAPASGIITDKKVIKLVDIKHLEKDFSKLKHHFGSLEKKIMTDSNSIAHATYIRNRALSDLKSLQYSARAFHLRVLDYITRLNSSSYNHHTSKRTNLDKLSGNSMIFLNRIMSFTKQFQWKQGSHARHAEYQEQYYIEKDFIRNRKKYEREHNIDTYIGGMVK
ncbi:TPA: hypothetical protein PXP51_001865 [Yersinia enterocolitica]|nr:hypothetical protein [Yersinia enterocolitica]